MWGLGRDCHVITGLRIDVRLWLFEAGRVEANGTLCDEERLVVHLVPMGWWAAGPRWHNEFGGPEAVVLIADGEYGWDGLKDRSVYLCANRLP